MTREEAIETLKANYPDRCYESLRNAVDIAIESLEAEPIKHGHWIHEHLASTSGGSYAVVRCSNCLSQYPMTEENYCPNCGADMRPQEEVHYIPVPEWLKGGVEDDEAD